MKTDFDLIKSINEQISIVDMCYDNSIELVETYGSDYNFKLKCPIHKNGKERTPSCFLNEKENFMYCHGCKKKINVIDLYMHFNETSFIDTIKELSQNIEKKAYEKKEDNFRILVRVALLQRRMIKDFGYKNVEPKLIEVAEKLDSIKSSDILEAEALKKNLEEYIKELGG